jgi:hypothetical protein
MIEGGGDVWPVALTEFGFYGQKGLEAWTPPHWDRAEVP